MVLLKWRAPKVKKSRDLFVVPTADNRWNKNIRGRNELRCKLMRIVESGAQYSYTCLAFLSLRRRKRMISVIKSIPWRRSTCTSFWSKLHLNHSTQRRTHELKLRFLSSDQKDSTDEYLSSLGIENKDVQAGMKSALRGVFGNEITVDNLKGLGPQGTFNV